MTGYILCLEVTCEYQKTKEVIIMTVKTNAQGAKRKELVNDIAEWLALAPTYCATFGSHLCFRKA